MTEETEPQDGVGEGRRRRPSMRGRLSALVASCAPGELPLAHCALLVAGEEYPQLPVQRYLSRLDSIAEDVRDRLANEVAPVVVFQELLETLFQRHGFRGNHEAYYDPRNSYLNQVLDRRLGIPLTLGIIVLETGWRLGLPLAGVNFPGHFLVRFRGESMNLLCDPFRKGEVRFEDEAQAILDRTYGGMVRIQPSYLDEADPSQMLVRLLTNLKGIHLNDGDDERALAAVERILLIAPEAATEHRDRGQLLARLGRTGAAAEALRGYLQRATGAPDAGRIRNLLCRLEGPGGGASDA